MTTTLTIATHPLPSYPERLRALADDERIVARSQCRTCDAPMVRRAKEDFTDSFWECDAPRGTTPLGLADGYEVLDRLAETNVAAYSKMKAFHDVTGSWPWQHAHQPQGLAAVPDAS